jgi:hypothetical protein
MAMSDHDRWKILASGPWQRGLGDEPHRVVLVAWCWHDTGLDKFSVHTQQRDGFGPLSEGRYFTPSGVGGAVSDDGVQLEYMNAIQAFHDKLTSKIRSCSLVWDRNAIPVAAPADPPRDQVVAWVNGKAWTAIHDDDQILAMGAMLKVSREAGDDAITTLRHGIAHFLFNALGLDAGDLAAK